MALMPGAVFLDAPFTKRPMERYDVVCVHTIVGFAPAHAAHFSTKADGTILQSRDTAFRSAANLDGNHRVIAIENEDHGAAFGPWNVNDGQAVPALTTEQVEANARILRWAHEVHGIPLQLCPDSRPTSRGLAYHRQGIDGNFDSFAFPGRVDDGEVWTEHFGKVCPGDRRIAQLPDILRIARGEDDMTPEEVRAAVRSELESFARRGGDLIKLDHDDDPNTPKHSLEERVQRIEAALAALPAEVRKGVQAGLAEAVIDVNVNVGTKQP